MQSKNVKVVYLYDRYQCFEPLVLFLGVPRDVKPPPSRAAPPSTPPRHPRMVRAQSLATCWSPHSSAPAAQRPAFHFPTPNLIPTFNGRPDAMEAVGAGASILAFATLGLKSAKAVHEILGSLKDGRAHVDAAKRDVRELQSMLERLSRCRVITETSNPDGALAARIKTCADDLKTFADTLRGLAIDGTESRVVGKSLKLLKIFLSEKELARMRAVVLEHTAALSLGLQILER